MGDTIGLNCKTTGIFLLTKHTYNAAQLLGIFVRRQLHPLLTVRDKFRFRRTDKAETVHRTWHVEQQAKDKKRKWGKQNIWDKGL